MDHAKFFTAVRLSIFDMRLSANQVNGMEAILIEWAAKSFDQRWLAYRLATTYRKTGNTLADKSPAPPPMRSSRGGNLIFVKVRKIADGNTAYSLLR